MASDTTNAPEDDWSAFERGLDSQHQEFIKRLSALHPSLTRTEIRIGSMLKLGLNTHEIATLLHLSERSVESCRVVIRRKLGMKKGEDIRALLELIYRNDIRHSG